MKIKLQQLLILFFVSVTIQAQVTLEREVKITDLAMYFNGVRNQNSTRQSETEAYDYAYGPALSPHGDCIKNYKQYVFMTWYRGGKLDRHVMLTRYNTETGAMKTIEFPHQHTGLKGKWWIGETHNTIAIGISPLNGTIHMVYDMHAYTNSGAFTNDYFRYTYSVPNAAELSDEEFTLDKFVKDPIDGDYKHCTMDGVRDAPHYDRFTYPQFFLNNQGELFLTARDGTSHDGAQAFIKYDANATKWGRFTHFNALGAGSKGETNNWSIYGSIKYANGKIRAGFQRRLNTGSDKYQFQNGVYYAYSDDPSGASQWKNHKGEDMTYPLVKAEEVLVFEPGDLVETTAQNKVHIVSGFDWTVTDNEDVHIISRVKDNENNITKYIHSYKPNGASEFIISTDFNGAQALYTSGEYVYIIGLNSSGRPFVERAEGGTNLFTKVYEQTSGRRFSKGQVYIADGKLYYYLLENNAANNTTTTRTTYLQVIDLAVENGPKPFAVNLVTPTDNQSFNEGDNVQLYAIASADEGEITKVAFMVNDELLEEDATKPYILDWTPETTGTYQIKAVAYKTSGESITSTEVSIAVNEIDESDLTINTYRLQNTATGKFLVAANTAEPVTMSDSGEKEDWHWDFFKLTKDGKEYHNIDSKQNGVLRATGAGFAAGAFLVVSTTKSPTVEDSDKIWTVHYNEDNKTFRFEAGTSKRYMYHDVDGNIYTKDVEETDARSIWKAIPTNQVLSVAEDFTQSSGIQIFPNPAKSSFNISLNKIGISEIVITDMLGKIVYETVTDLDRVEVARDHRFTSGVYIVKVTAKKSQSKIFYQKLVFE